MTLLCEILGSERCNKDSFTMIFVPYNIFVKK